MADRFGTYGDSLAAPSTRPYVVVPSDTDPLPEVPKGIFVGTGGDVVLRGANGSADVTYKNLGDGSYIAVRASHVRATGTTAANLIAEA
jgi:hypothetical protein